MSGTFACSSMQSFPLVLHQYIQPESFSWVTVHKWLLWGTVLHGQAASTWVPHGVTSPASKSAPQMDGWAALSTGHRSCQEPAPTRVSHGVTAPSGTSTCSGVGFSRGCRCVSLHHHELPWVAGESQQQHMEHLLFTIHYWTQCLQSCSSHNFSLLSSLTSAQKGFFSS